MRKKLFEEYSGSTLIYCPFCGKTVAELSNAKDIEECRNYDKCPHYEGEECSMFTVVCNYNNGGCGASIGYHATAEAAIETWNKRADNTGVMMTLSHEELVNLIVGFGDGGSYSIMSWLDSHGYGDFYEYVGGFRDEFTWVPDKLKTLSDEELLALYKEIQQFKK